MDLLFVIVFEHLPTYVAFRPPGHWGEREESDTGSRPGVKHRSVSVCRPYLINKAFAVKSIVYSFVVRSLIKVL